MGGEYSPPIFFAYTLVTPVHPAPANHSVLSAPVVLHLELILTTCKLVQFLNICPTYVTFDVLNEVRSNSF